MPEAENAALVLARADAAMSKHRTAVGRWEGWVKALPRNKRIDDDMAAEIREGLKEVEPALREVRALADYPRGRYEVSLPKNLIETMLPHTEKVRHVQRLLAVDAASRAEGGDFPRAA